MTTQNETLTQAQANVITLAEAILKLMKSSPLDREGKYAALHMVRLLLRAEWWDQWEKGRKDAEKASAPQ